MLCGFALFVPLSDILDVFFQVKTVIKPFRLFLLLAIGFYGIKVLSHGISNLNYREDVTLYLVFLYGLFISTIRMITPEFSMKLFKNDIFQITLYLVAFFILKNIRLTHRQAVNILWFLVIGIAINCFYLFNSFYFMGNYAREGGFMDNPNQVALSIVLAVAFVIYRTSVTQKLFLRLIYIGLVLFLLFVFPVTGSRTGLVILLLTGLLLFIFASYRTKFLTLISSLALVFFFSARNMDNFNVGASFVLTNRVIKKASSDEKDVRFVIWDGAIRKAEETWFTGIGIGQFKAQFARIFQTSYHETVLQVVDRRAFLSAHSDYIALLVIYGIVGLFLYLVYLFNLIMRLIRQIRFAESEEEQRFYQFGMMTVAALATFGLTAENFLNPLYWILLAVCSSSFIYFEKTATDPQFVDEDNDEIKTASLQIQNLI